MCYPYSLEMAKISRRKFLGLSALALPAAAGINARWGATTRLRVNGLKLNDRPKTRFVHFSDLHYTGDARYAGEVVETINQLRPDFVCFTGDLVERRIYASEALGFIREIRAPVYGIPGNHDYWSRSPFSEYERAFAATGGLWLANRSVVLPQHDLELLGMDVTGMPKLKSREVTRHFLLIHYPVMADRLGSHRFDLILAGHSHGGQVRIPFLGPVITPLGVGCYDWGHYETPAGPLYVSSGIGTLSSLPVRLNCPPEITVVTI
jgi:predicted MPP superfamily phosphohydrolase